VNRKKLIVVFGKAGRYYVPPTTGEYNPELEQCDSRRRAAIQRFDDVLNPVVMLIGQECEKMRGQVCAGSERVCEKVACLLTIIAASDG
jgi:hypothetical protein